MIKRSGGGVKLCNPRHPVLSIPPRPATPPLRSRAAVIAGAIIVISRRGCYYSDCIATRIAQLRVEVETLERVRRGAFFFHFYPFGERQ